MIANIFNGAIIQAFNQQEFYYGRSDICPSRTGGRTG
jgi:hypothetical protein